MSESNYAEIGRRERILNTGRFIAELGILGGAIDGIGALTRMPEIVTVPGAVVDAALFAAGCALGYYELHKINQLESH